VAQGKSRVKAKAKLESFARQYVINHFNGQQAAIAAGFAPKSAKVTASRLLTKANVKALISRLTAPTIKKEQITVERTLVELARLAYLDPGQIVDENNKLLPIPAMPADVRACIAGMDTSAKGKVTHVKIADKARALYMLCQCLKMFSEERIQDLGVKYIVLDMPRPPRPGATAVSPQLPSLDSRPEVTQVDEHANQKAQLGLKAPEFLPNLSSSK